MKYLFDMEITVSDKIKKLHDNDMKIYPKFNMAHKFAVCIEDPRKIVYSKEKVVGEYKHTSRTINTAIEETLNHLYKKLTNT